MGYVCSFLYSISSSSSGRRPELTPSVRLKRVQRFGLPSQPGSYFGAAHLSHVACRAAHRAVLYIDDYARTAMSTPISAPLQPSNAYQRHNHTKISSRTSTMPFAISYRVRNRYILPSFYDTDLAKKNPVTSHTLTRMTVSKITSKDSDTSLPA